MQTYGKQKLAESAMVDVGLAGNSKTVPVRSLLEMRSVHDTIEAWMRFLGYPRMDIFAFRLALGEAVANALQHGHHNDRAKSVQVTYAVLNDEAMAEVADDGAGFDPEQVPCPISDGKFERAKGLGLFLMRAYASWISFNRQGNRVTLCRRRSAT